MSDRYAIRRIEIRRKLRPFQIPHEAGRDPINCLRECLRRSGDPAISVRVYLTWGLKIPVSQESLPFDNRQAWLRRRLVKEN